MPPRSTLTYLNSFGTHQLLTRNANAPLPGTDTAPPSSVRPNGLNQNIYQYDSEAVFKQNQLIVNLNLRLNNSTSLSGYYQFGHADSDTQGVNSNPSDSYDILADYGRASFDVRQRLFLTGTYATPRYNIRFSPFIMVQSGSPFNITRQPGSQRRLLLHESANLRLQPILAHRGSDQIRSFEHRAAARRDDCSHLLRRWAGSAYLQSACQQEHRFRPQGRGARAPAAAGVAALAVRAAVAAAAGAVAVAAVAAGLQVAV